MENTGIKIDVGSVLEGAGKLAQEVKSLITGEPTPEAKAQAQAKMLELEGKIEDANNAARQVQAQVLMAEINGESWLQKNWRPILMLTIVAIVANNYIVVPYLTLFGVKTTMLELPEKLWNLMTLGVGGYVAGRTVEKGIGLWRQK